MVDSSFAPITVATDRLEGELRLVTTYSKVELILPPESSFRLEAKVKGGNINSDFRQADWSETRNDEVTELRGTTGGGASPVIVETSYADIEVTHTLQAEEQ